MTNSFYLQDCERRRLTKRERWVSDTFVLKKKAAIQYDAWQGVLQYLQKVKAEGMYQEWAKYNALKYRWFLWDTMKRLWGVHLLLRSLCSSNVPLGMKRSLVKMCIKRFFLELLGIRAAALVGAYFVK